MNENIKFITEDDIIAMGKRIQEARKEKGIKAIDFADMIGIGKDQLSRIENGKVACKMEYLFAITIYLEVSTDYLFYGISNPETELVQFVAKLDKEKQLKAYKVLRVMFED